MTGGAAVLIGGAGQEVVGGGVEQGAAGKPAQGLGGGRLAEVGEGGLGQGGGVGGGQGFVGQQQFDNSAGEAGVGGASSRKRKPWPGLWAKRSADSCKGSTRAGPRGWACAQSSGGRAGVAAARAALSYQ